MDDRSSDRALFRLLTWLSPAFPTGAFAYSHGLERAVHDRQVVDREDLHGWLADLIGLGSGWNDAVLVGEAVRRAGSGGDLHDLDQLAQAAAASGERHHEATAQGAAFLAAARAWPCAGLERVPPDACLAVAVGATAGLHGIDPRAVLTAYLHGFVSNLVQAALRLMPLGQSDGVAIVAALEDRIHTVAARAAVATLDDLGSVTFAADIAALRHETQTSRIFRS